MNDENLKRNVNGICVYGIRCKETKRIYIGSTCELRTRLKTHFRKLKSNGKRITSNTRGKNRGMKHEHPFQEDFNKFGIESFEVFVLEENVPKHLRDEREEYWINLYRATDRKYGYNLHERCRQGKVIRETDFFVPVHFELPPIPEVRNDV